jgi:ribosomal protein S27AE
MTDASFPHLPPGTDLSDPRQLRLCAALPELPAGKEPPPHCPVCGSAPIAPEDSGMDFPEGTVVYACLGAYAPPEEDEQEEPKGWEAVPPCWNVSAERALELVGSWCSRHPELVPVARLLQGESNRPAPELPEPGSGVWLRLRDLKAERLPSACPICGSAAAHQDDSFTRYECGALFSLTSRVPDAQGNLVPEKWAGESPCGKPSLRQLLTVLGRRFPPASRAADTCRRALQLVRA